MGVSVTPASIFIWTASPRLMCLLLISADREKIGRAVSGRFTSTPTELVNSGLAVGTAAQQQSPNVFIDGKHTYVWLGTPFFLGAAVTKESFPRIRHQIITSPECLNGAFFIVIATEDQTTLITDRFGSIPLFYAFFKDRGMVLSSGYLCLLEHLGADEKGGISEPALFEFLYMRRLFGLKTYHGKVKCLPSASVVTVDCSGKILKIEKFWRHKLVGLGNQVVEGSDLAAGLIDASRMYLRDDVERYGLMLSGGLDSRALLSLGGARYKSFTTARKKNNEVEIAQKLSNMFNVPHEFLMRDPEYMAQNFDLSVLASNAMTVFYECQFLGQAQTIAAQVDIVHMGIGLDIFFCGHYMYKSRPKFLGRPALFFVLKDLDSDILERTFINEVSYRLKTSSLTSIVKPEAMPDLNETLLGSIEEKMDEGRACGFYGHNLWEYKHLTDIGRHYTTLMARSLSCYVPVEVPCFENNLYDLAFSTSIDGKVNWRVYQKALTGISDSAMRIRNSNTNLPAHLSLQTQTLLNMLRSVAGRLTRSSRLKRMPGFGDRSWPAVKDDLENSFFRDKMEALSEAGAIMSLSFIDPDRLRKVIREHQDGRHDHAVLLSLLFTLEHGLLRH